MSATRDMPRYKAQDFGADAAIGNAIAGFGEKAGRAVGHISAEIERKSDEDELYAIQSRFSMFDLDQERRLEEGKRNAPPEAKEFSATYMKEYDTAAREFMTSVPDRLKPRVDAMLARRADHWGQQANRFELTERDRYHTEMVGRDLTTLHNDSTAAPERWQTNADRGIAIIRASKLPPRMKLETERKYLEANDEAAIRALIDRAKTSEEDVGPLIERIRKTPKGSLLPQQVPATNTIEFIKQQEGDKDVGWDYRQYSGPYGVKRGANERLTVAQAEARLTEEVAGVETDLDAKVKAPLTPNQRTALVSLFYSIGTGKGRLDQVAQMINDGQTDKVPAWIRQFTRNADGGYMPGLAARRDREATLFASGAEPVKVADARGKTRTDAVTREVLPDIKDIEDIERNKESSSRPLDETARIPQDDPVEADDAEFRHLRPEVRRKMITIAREAQRAYADKKIDDAVASIKMGREPKAGPDGTAEYERMLPHLTPHQRRTAEEKIYYARSFSEATKGMADLTREEIKDRIDALSVRSDIPEGQLGAHEKAMGHALLRASQIAAVRDKDPVLAVIGSEKHKIPPAREILDLNRARSATMPKNEIWARTFEARIAAQERLMPDRISKLTPPRLLTADEAKTLLPIQKGMETPTIRTAVRDAADKAMKLYGPEWAESALKDAIRWRLGDDEKNDAVRMARSDVGREFRSLRDRQALDARGAFRAREAAEYDHTFNVLGAQKPTPPQQPARPVAPDNYFSKRPASQSPAP